MRRRYFTRFLCHHGRKGQKWGIRNGPPYSLDDEIAGFTNKLSYAKINSALADRSTSKRKTLILPKKEYAKVMSEIATHISNEQRQQEAFTKCIGDYMYYVENGLDGTYRIIGKRKIK